MENTTGETTLKAPSETFLAHLLCGAGAGLISDAIVHPIDTCRTRLQVQRGVGSGLFYKNTADAFTKIVRQEGAKALYKGFTIVASFTVPAHALYFWGYETAKRTLQPSVPLEEKGALVHFVSGMFADLMGSFIWVPQDVVKQRLQVQKTSLASAAADTVKYKGSLHCIKTIIKEEGFLALWTVREAGLPEDPRLCLGGRPPASLPAGGRGVGRSDSGGGDLAPGHHQDQDPGGFGLQGRSGRGATDLDGGGSEGVHQGYGREDTVDCSRHHHHHGCLGIRERGHLL
ncbi:carrier superfamily protein [Acanthamoeba castellanii str. Neff]|uniref:Carrier superfamily protein n=1 Tax=Acanthamoeba castellanii (strain ATCC 30010 / Neff) TaxID=1257118 RepID=L8HFF4_ACACF|nr:carrier superfamily protein [Acanthamoeba castellanii str. Neff]ELR23136.1 carrier superfamily protein [Acanthamoeba castellanii str. Neff]